MRRELEKLNYAGHWTVNPSGAFVGINGAHEYRFEHVKKAGGYDVVAWKKSRTTQRETRVTQFCASNITRVQSAKKIERFVRAVVEDI
jgi:hypothetical protein